MRYEPDRHPASGSTPKFVLLQEQPVRRCFTSYITSSFIQLFFFFFPNLLGTAKSITCGSFIWPSAQSASPWIPADRSSLPLPPGVLALGPWTRTSRQSTAPIKKTGYHLLAIKPTRCVKSSRAENRSLFRVWLVRGLSRWIPHIAVTENHCCLTKSQSMRSSLVSKLNETRSLTFDASHETLYQLGLIWETAASNPHICTYEYTGLFFGKKKTAS